ncbi:MAG TPA: hypothetical protein VE650_14610, partial [Acetobacteraceae bacterium]|nr:hypothetical protein [Acetobacteraceae bacterium]
PLAIGQKVLVIAGNQARIVPDYTVPPEPAPTPPVAAPSPAAGPPPVAAAPAPPPAPTADTQPAP